MSFRSILQRMEELSKQQSSENADKNVSEAAKWRQGYRASGHPPGFQHKTGEVGPIGGTYDTVSHYGDETKVPVHKYRDELDPLADRQKAGISTTGKQLLPKNKQRNIKDMIKRSSGKHGPVGVLPEEQLDEVAPEGWEGTVKAMKKHKDQIDNPWALTHYMKGKGYKSHKDESIEEDVDTGEYDARKTTPSSKEEQDKVHAKHRERMKKLRSEMDDEDKKQGVAEGSIPTDQVDMGADKYTLKLVSKEIEEYDFEYGMPYDYDTMILKYDIYDAQGNKVGTIEQRYDNNEFSKKITNSFETMLKDKRGNMIDVPQKYSGSIFAKGPEVDKVRRITKADRYINKYLVNTQWYQKNILGVNTKQGVAEGEIEDAEKAHQKIQTPAALRKKQGGDWKVSSSDLEKSKARTGTSPEGLAAIKKLAGVEDGPKLSEDDSSMTVKAKEGDVEVLFGPVDSEGAIVSVRKNGQEIANGDYDRYAGKIWIGNDAFDSSKDVASHYASQMSENEYNQGVLRHKGTYGGEFATDIEGEPAKKAEPAVKRGRGRPRKDADPTGYVPKYDFAKALQSFMVGNVPSKGLPGKAGIKYKISDKPEFYTIKLNDGSVLKDENGKIMKFLSKDKAYKIASTHKDSVVVKNVKNVKTESSKPNKLKNWIERVETEKLIESTLQESGMKRVYEILSDIAYDGDINQALQVVNSPKDKYEEFAREVIQDMYDMVIQKSGGNLSDKEADRAMMQELQKQFGQELSEIALDASQVAVPAVQPVGTTQQTTTPQLSSAQPQGQQATTTTQSAQPKMGAAVVDFKQANDPLKQALAQAVKNKQVTVMATEEKSVKERHMTKTEKEKEQRLKTKYDDSDMKAKMIDQYGEEKGKQIYFATIRKKAMSESVEHHSLNEKLADLLKNYPHEKRLMDEGWGMHESLYQALCDHYWNEGRIPREVMYGPSESLRSYVEEAYMEDTNPVMENPLLGIAARGLATGAGAAIADRAMDKLGLEEDSMYEEQHDDQNPVMNAIYNRIIRVRPDLLRYDLDLVTDAIRDVADSVGEVWEIGSSDVSGWVRRVEEILKDSDKLDEYSVSEGYHTGYREEIIWHEVLDAIKANPNSEVEDSLRPLMKKYNLTIEFLNLLAKKNGYDSIRSLARDSIQEQTMHKTLSEKWDTETEVSPEEKGKYKGKTKEELLKTYNKLKKSGPHKKGSEDYGRMRELAFAIRAKSGWGKVKEESSDDLTESWETQLHSLLKEGVTITTSTGNQGAPDNVSVNATDADAHELMKLIQSSGLGKGPSQAMSMPAQDGAAVVVEPVSQDEVMTTLQPEDDGQEAFSFIKKMIGARNHDGHDHQHNADFEQEDSDEVHEDNYELTQRSNPGDHVMSPLSKAGTNEELTGGQKKLDKAPPFGKLTKDDFAKLRAEKDVDESALDQPATMEGEWDQTGSADMAASVAQDADAKQDAETEKEIAMSEETERCDECGGMMEEGHACNERVLGQAPDEGPGATGEKYGIQGFISNEEDEHLTEWANSPQGKSEDEMMADMIFMTKSISGGLNNIKQDQTVLPSARVKTEKERYDTDISLGALLQKLQNIN